MNNDRLYSLLAFAGAAPFVACALLAIAGVESLGPLGRLDAVAVSYGLAIVSFLAGAHWATFLYREEETPFNLFASSNIVLLAVWFSFVLADIEWQLLSQALAFLFLLFVDYRLLQGKLITASYFRVRAAATALACISLMALILVS